MKKDERGYIVIEASFSFVLFILTIMSILMLVNITTVQARVHYALTQTANTISVYSYLLDVTGAAGISKQIHAKHSTVVKGADEMKADIRKVLNGLDLLAAKSAVTRAQSWAGAAAEDPGGALQLIVNAGLGEGKNALTEQLVRPLVEYYLKNGDLKGKKYLELSNVIGDLDFYSADLLNIASSGQNDSVIIDENGDIKLTVNYKIRYQFGFLPLPFKELEVSQTVKTKAWLQGSGEGYEER